jgi:hypothetical protein
MASLPRPLYLHLVVMMTVMMSAMNDHDLFGAGTVPAALTLPPTGNGAAGLMFHDAPVIAQRVSMMGTILRGAAPSCGRHATKIAQAARTWLAVLRTRWMKLSLAPAMRIERNAMHRRAVKREVLASGT